MTDGDDDGQIWAQTPATGSSHAQHAVPPGPGGGAACGGALGAGCFSGIGGVGTASISPGVGSQPKPGGRRWWWVVEVKKGPANKICGT